MIKKISLFDINVLPNLMVVKYKFLKVFLIIIFASTIFFGLHKVYSVPLQFVFIFFKVVKIFLWKPCKKNKKTCIDLVNDYLMKWYQGVLWFSKFNTSFSSGCVAQGAIENWKTSRFKINKQRNKLVRGELVGVLNFIVLAKGAFIKKSLENPDLVCNSFDIV